MSETTIGVSNQLKRELIRRKQHIKESYEEVIWRIIKKN
jgi:predicted CopG family antitoxin